MMHEDHMPKGKKKPPSDHMPKGKKKPPSDMGGGKKPPRKGKK